jgi:GNAT superfamily N-acetyltransferase
MIDCQAETPALSSVDGMPACRSQWTGRIRRLEVAEFADFEQHLLRLSDSCRCLRFCAPVSDTFIRQYASGAHASNTVIFGCFIDGVMRAAVEVRSSQAGWGQKAEIAFSVEREWQSRGIGSVLMTAAIPAAGELGVQQLYLSFAAFNRRMRSITEKYAASMEFADGEYLANVNVPIDSFPMQGESAA